MEIKGYLRHLKSISGLSLQLAKSNFKLRNEGSFFGIFWYLLEPLSLFLIIVGLRAMLGGGGIEHYPLYLLLGLIMFNFFSGTTSRATSLIISNANFIKSMKINHESLIVSQVVEGIFSHFFEILLFVFFMVYFKVQIIWILFYFIILFFLSLFVLGMSFILSTIGAYVNDLNNVWRVITRLLFFITPLFYVLSEDSAIYTINLFNPMYYFILITRELVIYHVVPSIKLIGIVMGMSLIVFLVGVYIFEKFKYKFAEVV